MLLGLINIKSPIQQDNFAISLNLPNYQFQADRAVHTGTRDKEWVWYGNASSQNPALARTKSILM